MICIGCGKKLKDNEEVCSSCGQKNSHEVKDSVIEPSHYLQYEITPSEFCYRNKIEYNVANVIKYTLRFKEKNGIEDLKKAKKYLELIAMYEYGEEL